LLQQPFDHRLRAALNVVEGTQRGVHTQWFSAQVHLRNGGVDIVKYNWHNTLFRSEHFAV
jgi:hypothetical protein